MKPRRISASTMIAVQLIVMAVFGVTLAMGSASSWRLVRRELSGGSLIPSVKMTRQMPLTVEPLYDEPDIVSDEELAAVLVKIQPRFWDKDDFTRPVAGLKPNYVEHALRTWGVKATFDNPRVMSGESLKDYLVDHGKWLMAWSEAKPETVSSLIEETPEGVSIRWGKQEGGSVHHDHWLACLTEAGVPLDEPVFTPSSRKTMADVLQEALRDFRLDEAEVEWSVMAFGFWIAPQKEWATRSGRLVSFDMLAERLMRGHNRIGVCCGTHRLYSLMALIRLDDGHHMLSPDVRRLALDHLRSIRDLIVDSQFEDGHWPSNWADGVDAISKPVDDPLYKKVIATGHHLEWLAIAPKELHPPHELILKAAKWLIKTTCEQTDKEIGERYTFFSHVGNALALWRKTHPADFWSSWERQHPWSIEQTAP